MAPAPQALSRADALAQLAAQRAALARESFDAFCELVLLDERTGRAVRQAEMHRRWSWLAAERDRLVLLAHIESGKTSSLCVARTLWLLGRDPGLRIAIVSNTFSQSRKIIAQLRAYIERSAALHLVFPGLKLASARDDALTVVRSQMAKDASVACFGIDSSILGSRIDLLIIDDVDNFESTRTEGQRATTVGRIDSSLLTRVVEGGRVIAIGTSWHPDDALSQLARRQGWHREVFPVEREDGTPAWPERWSADRIRKKRAELGTAESSRQLDCCPFSDADSRFPMSAVQAALDRGRGRQLRPGILNVPTGARLITGVDLAVSKASSADLTVLFTICVWPNGMRELIGLSSGRWAGPEIVNRVLEAHERYQSVLCVEDVAAQAYIVHFARAQSNAQVISFRTGRGEHSLEWQVERLATELPAQWILPSDAQGRPVGEVAKFVRGLLQYDPRQHTPDHVAAACFARFAAEQGERRVLSFNWNLMDR